MLTLIEILSDITDNRRAQGLRTSLPSFLSMYVLANMSGNYSLQSVARFFKENATCLTEMFKLTHPLPAYTQIRTIVKNLNYDSLSIAFHKWASQLIDDQQECKWASIDGKAMKSTVTNCHNSEQNFHAMVSMFVAHESIVLGSKKYQNKKNAESFIATELLEELKITGYIITMDALHCKKKPLKQSWSLEMIM